MGSDPGDLIEAVGDDDAIKSTALGMKNLERVAGMLLPATSTKKGEPYEDLTEIYGRMLGQWTLEMGHVAALLGGFYSREKHVGQDGVRFTPVPRERQAAAVKFLNENAFSTPEYFIKLEILRRIEPVGALERARTAQREILNNLLSNWRLARLVEQEALDGKGSYSPTDFLADVRKGIWKELEGGSPVRIDAYRRNLQRAYLELMNERLNMPPMPLPVIPGFTFPPGTEDVRPFFRGELRAVHAAAAAALARTADRETRLHLEDVKDQTTRILDPKFAPSVPATPRSPSGLDGSDPPNICWPDYAIGFPERR